MRIIFFIIMLFITTGLSATPRIDTIKNYKFTGNNYEKKLISRSVNSFNRSNIILRSVQQNRIDSNNTWQNAFTVAFEYDFKNNLIREKKDDWDAAQRIWNRNSLITYTYDANDSLIQKVTSLWNPIKNDWDYTLKTEKIYTNNGKLSEETEYYRKEKLNAWIPFKHCKYTYDNATLTQDVLWQKLKRDSSGLENYLLAFTQYDKYKNEILSIDKYWKEEDHQWRSSSKIVATTNNQGKITEQSGFEWHEEYKSWYYWANILFKYDEHGNETEWLWLMRENVKISWPNSIMLPIWFFHLIQSQEHITWNNFIKYTYEYNASGKIAAKNSLFWDTKTHEFKPSNRTEYCYINGK